MKRVALPGLVTVTLVVSLIVPAQAAGLPVAVVSGIVGMRGYVVTLSGKANNKEAWQSSGRASTARRNSFTAFSGFPDAKLQRA